MNEKQNELNRRKFIQTGTMATAGITAFNILKSKDARAAAPIKVGVIGVGGRGKAAAEDAIRSYEGVKITAIADLFPYQIELAKKRFAKSDQKIEEDHCFSGFDAYQKLLKTDVDYVILTTPPVFRPPILEAAVEAGKHVFMEKTGGCRCAWNPPDHRRRGKSQSQKTYHSGRNTTPS